MIVTTIDPVTGNRVTDLDRHPFIIEGQGVAAMKIYFESEATRQAYVDTLADPAAWFDNRPPPTHS